MPSPALPCWRSSPAPVARRRPAPARRRGPTAAASEGAVVSAEPSAAPSVDTTPVTIKVWDYYGESTPIKPALAGFAKEYPWITVDYQALDWDSMNEKFTAGLGAGEVPDLATLDMTWIPTLASNGALEDLHGISGDQLNGNPIADQYTPGAIDAMTYGDQMVSMLYDFDTYSLYYRKDLFDQKGIKVPDQLGRVPGRRQGAGRVVQAGRQARQVPDRDPPEQLPLLAVPVPGRRLTAQRRQQPGRLQRPGRRRRGEHPEGAPRRRQRQVLAGCRRRPDPGDQVRRGGDVPGRPVLHGPAQDRRARAGRQVGRGHRALLEAARQLSRRDRTRASPSRRPTRTPPGCSPSTSSDPRTRSACSTTPARRRLRRPPSRART